VDRDCPHQLKAKGFGLCGSVGNQSSKGQSAHLSPKVTFFNVVKNIPCLFPATKVFGSKWAVGAEAGLSRRFHKVGRYLRHDATPLSICLAPEKNAVLKHLSWTKVTPSVASNALVAVARHDPCRCVSPPPHYW